LNTGHEGDIYDISQGGTKKNPEYFLTCPKCGHQFNNGILITGGQFGRLKALDAEYHRRIQNQINSSKNSFIRLFIREYRELRKDLEDRGVPAETIKSRLEDFREQRFGVLLNEIYQIVHAGKLEYYRRIGSTYPRGLGITIDNNEIRRFLDEIRRHYSSPEWQQKELKGISELLENEDKRIERHEGFEKVRRQDLRRKMRLKVRQTRKDRTKIKGHGEDYYTNEMYNKFLHPDERDPVKIGSDFENLGWGARQDAWMEWYKQEMENLRAAYEKGDMSTHEFRQNTSALKQYINNKIGIKGKWSAKMKSMTTHHFSSQMKSVAYLLGAILIGAIVSGTTGSYLFMMGFLGVALYLIAPDPNNIKPREGQKIGFSSMLLFHPETKSKQNTAGMLRSFGKVTAIAFFAFGFQGLGSVFNTLYIITAVVGYFLLKVEYGNSPEFIESMLRFFLGMLLIPWIFNDIFQSLVLAGIAFAFFAIPPLPREDDKDLTRAVSRGLSGATAYYELAEKFIFGFIMIIVLIASGALSFTGVGLLAPASGWELSGSLAYTFIYFWLICGVAGFFSPAKERPLTGAIMLGAATVIYGIGPGSQAIGSGLLGDWWPTVHETFGSITAPITTLMESLGNTFGQGFLLLTNPVGYATQLMNGSYADNPSGSTGSFGVDITSLTVTNIFPEQPYVVTAIMENKGSFAAENVSVSLVALSSDKFGTEAKARTGESFKIWNYQTFKIENLGFSPKKPDGTGSCDEMSSNECLLCFGGKDKCLTDDPKFEKLYVWQAAFSSEGIPCNTITGFDLRKKFIPFTTKVKYDYKSDSRVEVEFISQSEWDRLAQAGQLDNRFKFVQSQYSSAPVIFPIGTAGLKNPILETQQFHIRGILQGSNWSN
jgi:hypothetical protein